MKKISNKQLAKNMQNFLGKRIRMINGKHQGQTGFTTRVYERKNMKPILMAKLDSGIEIEAKHGDCIFLVMENGVRIDSIPKLATTPPEIQNQINEAEKILTNIENHNSKFNAPN